MEAELAGPVEDVVERAGAGCAGGGRISARNTCSADGRVADSVLCKQREQSQVKASKGEQRRAKAGKQSGYLVGVFWTKSTESVHL